MSSPRSTEAAAQRTRVAVLGSTGSIGTQTLDVLAAHPEAFELVAIAAGRNRAELESQQERFRPAAAVLAGEDAAPLVEHIRPSNTIEGLAGGLVVATLAAGIGAALVGLDAWHPLVIGPAVGLAAQAGDLVESMLKRAAGRKESGFLVPGHGGVLDRVDSFLFAAPVLAGYAILAAGRVV